METWPPPLVRDQRKVTWQTDEEVRTTPSFIVQLPCAGRSPQCERLPHSCRASAIVVVHQTVPVLHLQRHAVCSVLNAVEPWQSDIREAS